MARLEEVLQIALQLWSGEDRPFEGKYYHLTSTIGIPWCVQRPHPPILIAGQGNKMLRLMARYADVVSLGFGRELDALRSKLAYLRQQCEELERPYEAIEKTTFFTPPLIHNGRLDPEALDTISARAEMGFDEIMIRQAPDPATFEVLASELLPAVSRIPVAGR